MIWPYSLQLSLNYFFLVFLFLHWFEKFEKFPKGLNLNQFKMMSLKVQTINYAVCWRNSEGWKIEQKLKWLGFQMNIKSYENPLLFSRPFLISLNCTTVPEVQDTEMNWLLSHKVKVYNTYLKSICWNNACFRSFVNQNKTPCACMPKSSLCFSGTEIQNSEMNLLFFHKVKVYDTYLVWKKILYSEIKCLFQVICKSK